MKAIVLHQSCTAEGMTISHLPIPTVIPGWVLVKIRAFGLNHSEVLLRQFEIDCDYIRKPVVPGIECVGEIADASNSDFHVGDTVVALMGGMGRSFDGSYAEYALLPSQNVFKADRGNLTWAQLAAVPETYFTAYGSLFQCLLIQPTDILLVRGATSTVGQAAIQLAKVIGATTIAACRRESSFEPMRKIGADYCIIDNENLQDADFKIRPNKILELVGPKTLRDSMLTVSRPGYVCNTGILGNEFVVKDFDPIKYIPNGVFLSGFFSNYPSQEDIDGIFRILHQGNISPLYSQTFPLKDIAKAHLLLEKGGAGGKIVVLVD